MGVDDGFCGGCGGRGEWVGGLSGEFLGGLAHGHAEGLEFLDCAICAGEMTAFGAVELEVVLACWGVVEEVGRIGDAEDIRGHEIHTRCSEHLKHIYGLLIRG